MTLVISGEIRIDPADFDAAMALVGPFVATTQAEAGCVAYDFWVDPGDRGRIRLFEEWTSDEANAGHVASEHLADFYAAMAALRVTSVELVRYEVSTRAPLSAPSALRVFPGVPAPITHSVGMVAGVVTAPARLLVGGVARRALAGPRTQRTELAFASDADPGWFGPDSMTWRVHADRSMLIGGLRALFLQVLHPLAMAGVADHSSYREDPLGRLARTGRFVAATTYGTRAEAERAVGTVRAIHNRVRGTAEDGRAYDANDPTLLAWVHNVEVESFLAAYRRYGARPLHPDDADRYVAEMATVGRRLGAENLPETATELTAWIEAAPDLAMTGVARSAVRFLVLPNLPLPMLPTYAVIAAAAADLLPFHRRRALGLWPVPFADPLVVRPAAATLLALLGWALGPPPLPENAG